MTGRGIRRLRRQRGWTQAQLAKAAGVSKTLVFRVEHEQRVSADFRAYIVAALKPVDRSAQCRRAAQIGHRLGRAHKFTRDEAQAAGRKGGASVSADREHMRTIGRRGGVAAQEARRAK